MDSEHEINLSYFEKMLTAKQDEVTKNINSLKTEIDLLSVEDEVCDIEDMAEFQINSTIDQTQLKRLETELREVDEAINRIRTGAYGICEKTGRKIPIDRLLAYPYARTIVDA